MALIDLGDNESSFLNIDIEIYYKAKIKKLPISFVVIVASLETSKSGK